MIRTPKYGNPSFRKLPYSEVTWNSLPCRDPSGCTDPSCLRTEPAHGGLLKRLLALPIVEVAGAEVDKKFEDGEVILKASPFSVMQERFRSPPLSFAAGWRGVPARPRFRVFHSQR